MISLILKTLVAATISGVSYVITWNVLKPYSGSLGDWAMYIAGAVAAITFVAVLRRFLMGETIGEELDRYMDLDFDD